MRTELNSIEYIGEVFKGLSTERKEYLLDTARSLIRVQDGSVYSADSKTNSHTKKEKITFKEK
jgi:hypothetical protein